jgi:hypothetical protein
VRLFFSNPDDVPTVLSETETKSQYGANLPALRIPSVPDLDSLAEA